MRCSIISDSHIDINEWGSVSKFLKNKEKSDVLILAGDTCQDNYKKRQMFFERMIYPYYDIILEVPGNHSYYNGDFANVEYGCKKINDGHFMLNNGVKEIDGVKFIGSTLWSHIPAFAEMAVGQSLNDYHIIKNFNIGTSNYEYNLARQFILNEMETGKNNIVITHHAPFMNLIDERYKGSKINNAYATNLFNITEEPKINAKFWCHGHSHNYMEKEQFGCTFLRNPFGYHHHGEAEGFKIRTIDV